MADAFDRLKAALSDRYTIEREWRCARKWRSGHNPPYAHILRGTDSVPILGAAELGLSPKEEGRIDWTTRACEYEIFPFEELVMENIVIENR